jgi:general secretion pathway protein A
MYLQYFGLKENPFALPPDPRYLYLSLRHQEALAHLIYGITEGGGFVVLTGEVGTGKTMMIRAMLERLPETVDVALVLYPMLTVEEFVATICDELRAPRPKEGASLKALIDALNTYLLDNHARGRRTVLIIDEAQRLPHDVLEQVRLLTNLETTKEKLLQILLIGQPELGALLAQPHLRQLASRVTARYNLRALLPHETREYVNHRLRVAGARVPLFSAAAVRRLHWLSGGIPRAINTICDRALLGAYAHGRSQVGAGMVRHAAVELRVTEPGVRWRLARGAVLSLAAAVMLAAGGWWIAYGRLEHSAPATAAAAPQTAAQARNETVAPKPQPGTASGQNESREQAIAGLRPSAAGGGRGERGADTAPASSPHSDQRQAQRAAPPLSPAAPASSPSPTPSAAPASAEPQDTKDLTRLLAEADNDAAFTALFALWRLDYVQLAGDTACARAQKAGLRCLYAAGTWNNLRQYNRPAVIELHDAAGERRHALVVELLDDRVALELGGQRHWFTLAEVDRHWLGKFLLVWKAPAVEQANLRRGARGESVAWLRNTLARYYRQPATPGDLFDAELERQVQEFQRRHQLPADGIAGLLTMMQLTNYDPAIAPPLLWSAGATAQR